jgi:hypothetical protein
MEPRTGRRIVVKTWDSLSMHEYEIAILKMREQNLPYPKMARIFNVCDWNPSVGKRMFNEFSAFFIRTEAYCEPAAGFKLTKRQSLNKRLSWLVSKLTIFCNLYAEYYLSRIINYNNVSVGYGFNLLGRCYFKLNQLARYLAYKYITDYDFSAIDTQDFIDAGILPYESCHICNDFFVDSEVERDTRYDNYNDFEIIRCGTDTAQYSEDIDGYTKSSMPYVYFTKHSIREYIYSDFLEYPNDMIACMHNNIHDHNHFMLMTSTQYAEELLDVVGCGLNKVSRLCQYMFTRYTGIIKGNVPDDVINVFYCDFSWFSRIPVILEPYRNSYGDLMFGPTYTINDDQWWFVLYYSLHYKYPYEVAEKIYLVAYELVMRGAWYDTRGYEQEQNNHRNYSNSLDLVMYAKSKSIYLWPEGEFNTLYKEIIGSVITSYPGVP